MRTLKCSNRVAMPSAQVVEWLLYIITRHETDAAREMVLPINEPAGKIVFAQYQKERLTLRFLSDTNPPLQRCPSHRLETVFSSLAKERGWFFRWEGLGIGPMRLAPEVTATLAYHRCHDDRKSTIHASTLVDDRLIQFANKHFYP